MLMRLLLIIGVLLFGQVTGLSLPSVEASDKAAKLRGEVMALNTKEVPQILVMRVMTKAGAEMVVGALVDDKTRIEKKGESVTLDQLVEGDRVTLTYKITKEGALARTITIP
jgi:hypothetical protein